MRKTEHSVKFVILIFLGIAIQSMLIVTPVLNYLSNNQSEFFPLDFFVMYLMVSLIYSLVTSLYVYPSMNISPLYIHIGTGGFVIFLIIFQIVSTSNSNNISNAIIPIIAELGIFAMAGYGMTIFFRKIFGIDGEIEDIWNETYRIQIDFNSVKTIFDEPLFKMYKKVESSEKGLILKRNFRETSIIILLQPVPKDPKESILSIATSGMRFESMWKSDDAKDDLINIKKIITGSLYDKFQIGLKLDSEEKTISNKCVKLFLKSKESPLSKINKPTTLTIITVIGAITIGAIVTAFYFIQQENQQELLTFDTLVAIWVPLTLAILYSIGSEIKKERSN